MGSMFWECANCGQKNPAIVQECSCAKPRAKPQQVDHAYRLCVKGTSLSRDNDDTLRGFIMGFRCYERFATALDQALTPEQIAMIKGMS